jgi:hypothetical protein
LRYGGLDSGSHPVKADELGRLLSICSSPPDL